MAENFTRINGASITWSGNTGTAAAIEVGLTPGTWPETVVVDREGGEVVLSFVTVERPEGSALRGVYRSAKLFGIRQTLHLEAEGN